MTSEELKIKLDRHLEFIETGDNKLRANFTNDDLCSLDLSYRNLSGAIFRNAKCINTNFTGCNLSKAEFSSTELNNANFENANLEKSMFIMSDCMWAVFAGANLKSAEFNSCDLSYVNLTRSNRHGIVLIHNNMDYANLIKYSIIKEN